MNLIKATGAKIFLGLIISSAFSYFIQLIFNIEIYSPVLNNLFDVIGMCFIFDLLIYLGLYNFNTKGWMDINPKTWTYIIYTSVVAILAPALFYLINKEIGEMLMPWGLAITLLMLSVFISYRYLILPKLNKN